MRLEIKRNRLEHVDESLKETSNCEIYTKRKNEIERVGLVIKWIEKNSHFEAHHCPTDDTEYNGEYSNGFDIHYTDVPHFKELYTEAKIKV